MNTVRLIRVLASFPSDVSDEAAALDSIAAELNRTIGEARGVRFEILNWLRDVRAGSAGDVQEVVNRQVNGQYDVIVATFWTRAGTPTPRAASGSIEEVKAAVAASKSTGSLPFVLVYMRSGGADLLQLDPSQVAALAEFRNWLSDNGVLYKPFSDRASYEALLRVDLAKVGAEIADHGVRTPVENVTDAETDVAEEELGLLDYMDMQDAAFADMAQIIEGRSASLERLTDNTRRDTAEAERIIADGSDRAAIRRLLRRSSENLNSFSESSETQLLKFQQATQQGFHSMAMALSLGASSADDGRINLLTQLDANVETSRNAAESTRKLRDTHASFPRMTAEHNRAKRRVTDALDKWVVEFERTAALAQEIADSIRSQAVK